MGYIIDRANVLDRMFRALQLAIGGMPGSLAVATMIVCALWGIASGIVGAVVVLMGLLAMPAMLRAGYDHKLSAGVICAGGTLGILIPPSVMLILYGAVAGVSAVKLYAAAFIPGFGLTAAYLIYILAAGDVEASPRAEAAEGRAQRADRDDLWTPGLVHAADGPDHRRARGHLLRPGDAHRIGGDGRGRRADARHRLRRRLFEALGPAPHSGVHGGDARR